MSNLFFEKPILNSPYYYPSQHWELDKTGQPTQKVVTARRRAEFITPIPKPKKRKDLTHDQHQALRVDTNPLHLAKNRATVFFSVIDAVIPLTNSAKPCDYSYRIMQRENISCVEVSTTCRQLKLLSSVGKDRESDCVTTEIRKGITWNKIKPGDVP